MNACRGKLCLGATMPLAFALFGKSQPGRFFAGPTLALDVGGSTAWLAGHANPEELAGFLRFLRLSRPWCWMKPSVRRPPVGSGQRHTASSALRRGVSCRCLRRTLPSGRVLPKNQNLPPEKQRIMLFPDRPVKTGRLLLRALLQAQPGPCPGLDAGTGRKHHLYGGSLRAGKWSGIHGLRRDRGSSAGQRRRRAAHRRDGECPRRRRLDACLPLQPRAGAFLYPAWALRRWGSMHDMKYNNRLRIHYNVNVKSLFRLQTRSSGAG